MELFWYNIKEMDAAAHDAALSMMDAERRSRIGDFPNEDDRKRSAAGQEQPTRSRFYAGRRRRLARPT